MSMLQEFKTFAMRGNVMDLAVGVIIGGAFGKIITSLVGDVLMPMIGVLLLGVDLSALAFSIGNSTIKYGMFFQSVLDFVIVAFCIFLMIKAMNRFQKPAPPPPLAGPTKTEMLLTEIRDAVKK